MLAGVRRTDRIAVLGARGWLGRTADSLIPEDIPIFRTAASADQLHREWSLVSIQDFAPTVVLNFAFLTRERIAVEGVEAFTAINSELTNQFEVTATLPSVRAAITVSSGAAVVEPDQPYGALKLREEQIAAELTSPSRASVVLRAYSVSGPFVRRPRDYAFSDFILQAQRGCVRVSADHLVYRRYVDAADALGVAIDSVLSGWSGTIETGGELVEMGDLAHRIVHHVNPAASIERPEIDTSRIETYASDGSSWSQACARLGYVPRDLEEQIRVTADGLLAPNHSEESRSD